MSDNARAKTFVFDVLNFVTNRIVTHVPSRTLRLAFYRHVLDLKIGKRTAIFMGTTFDSRHGFRIGDDCVINQNCRIDNRGPVTIGNHVSISADVTILTGDHDIQASDFAGRERGVTIGDYAFLGTRCILLPGVNVGTGAVVASGSVVARDVPDYAIVAGNPAKPIGERNRDLTYTLDYRRWLH